MFVSPWNYLVKLSAPPQVNLWPALDSQHHMWLLDFQHQLSLLTAPLWKHSKPLILAAVTQGQRLCHTLQLRKRDTERLTCQGFGSSRFWFPLDWISSTLEKDLILPGSRWKQSHLYTHRPPPTVTEQRYKSNIKHSRGGLWGWQLKRSIHSEVRGSLWPLGVTLFHLKTVCLAKKIIKEGGKHTSIAGRASPWM